MIVGDGYTSGKDSTDARLLLNKGHRQMMAPPKASVQELRSDFAGGLPTPEVAAAGWDVHHSGAQHEDPRAPGDAARGRPRCRAEREAAKERQAGKEVPEGEDTRWRSLGN